MVDSYDVKGALVEDRPAGSPDSSTRWGGGDTYRKAYKKNSRR